MRVAIHQPHYFPWLGYFDKIAKADRFVLMDAVQLEDRSYMLRNRFLRKDGELCYLSVTAAKKGYREKKYNEIETMDNARWQGKHLSYLRDLYSRSPYRDEILERLMPVFTKDYRYLFEVTKDSILLCMELLDIRTETVDQSALDWRREGEAPLDKEGRRSGDVLGICRAAGATAYMTGTGASLEFLDMGSFAEAGIPVAVQRYECPRYPQMFSGEFIPNISALDMLFNCGIAESRRVFWENVNSTREFDEIEE